MCFLKIQAQHIGLGLEQRIYNCDRETMIAGEKKKKRFQPGIWTTWVSIIYLTTNPNAPPLFIQTKLSQIDLLHIISEENLTQMQILWVP